MSKKCVVVYDSPSLWRSAVYGSDNPNLEEAMRDLCPCYPNWPCKKTEEQLEPFTEEEIAAIVSAEPTNGSILVREENVGGIFAYRKIVSGGGLVPGFGEMHFNLDENKVKARLVDFLANLGANDIQVAISRSTKDVAIAETQTKSEVKTGSPIADGSGTFEKKDRQLTGNVEIIEINSGSAKNAANFDAARSMLENNAWFRDCFSGLYERVKSGRTHGPHTETITHQVVKEFYENSGRAINVATRYNMINGEVGTNVEKAMQSRKHETVSLKWSCVFP